MPLSPPAEREHIHHRAIDLKGYRRADGLWDIEGHLTDVKSYAFDNNWRGTIEAGQPIHGMWLRLTIDDEFTIHAVEAETDASPFPICPAITSNFQRLVGITIGKGWMNQVAQRVGGVEGCTHLVELLRPLATVAFQTIFPMRERIARKPGDPDTAGPPGGGERLINTCHAFRADGEIAQGRWPEVAAAILEKSKKPAVV